MEIKIDKMLKLSAQPFQKTRLSELYTAQFNEEEENTGLFYAVKVRKKGEFVSQKAAEREKKITQNIENSSPSSVVIPILMHCEDETQIYSVMQLKRNGKFLNEIMRELGQRSLDIRDRISCSVLLVKKIVSSLSFVHFCFGEEGGYLHLDLQPCNIFVENTDLEKMTFGTVKFIDFHTARKIRGDGSICDEEAICTGFTKGYSAPELLEQNIGRIGYSSDLYSVAVIFYKLLSGRELEDWSQIENFSLNGVSILSYQIRKFFECSLQYHTNYRYAECEKFLDMLEKMEACQEAYQSNDYFELFHSAYFNWIPQSAIAVDGMRFQTDSFHCSVEKLSRSLLQNGVDVQKCDYIFEALWKLQNKNPVDDQDKYQLISDGITLSNHLGNVQRGILLFEELQKIKDLIPVLDYIDISNRVAVQYADHYDFEEAFQIVDENARALELLKKTYEQIAKIKKGKKGRATAVYSLGRVYSAKGCYLALLKKKDPMEYFQKAIKEFDWQTGNISITQSHIMHYAIQIENGSGNGKHLYEEYAYEFFNGETELNKRYEDSIQRLCREERPDAYPLWIFMKGLLHFYSDQFTGKLYENIQKDFYALTMHKKTEFPMPLIYRYIALLEYKRNGNQVNAFVEDAFEKALFCCGEAIIDSEEPLNIVMCINYDTLRIYHELHGNNEECAEIWKQLLEHAEASGWIALTKKLRSTNTLQDVFGFEYC